MGERSREREVRERGEETLDGRRRGYWARNVMKLRGDEGIR